MIHFGMFVLGDLLGVTLKNIDKLLRMPSGCGEQTLINFVPAVMVARYLAVTNRFTPELRRKITTIIKTGLFCLYKCLIFVSVSVC